MLNGPMEKVTALEWTGTKLRLLDQRLLPDREEWVNCETEKDVAAAIRNLVVRGAPAIGIAAAFGMVLSAKNTLKEKRNLSGALAMAKDELLRSRPTAVNLFWAVERMWTVFSQTTGANDEERAKRLEEEALKIWTEDVEANERMGELGSQLVPPGARILTHCNTGALATGGYGTALGVIRSAFRQGKVQWVWVNETRPVLQGARLTMWECQKEGIPARLIADSAGPWLMQRGMVDLVIVGADRIVANGDVANKIGTYMLALSAFHHGIPFYVAAPTSTLDFSLPSGQSIPIEERSPEEVTTWKGVRVVPVGSEGFNPAFDVTPARLISGIITEKGVARPPFTESLKALSRGGSQ